MERGYRSEPPEEDQGQHPEDEEGGDEKNVPGHRIKFEILQTEERNDQGQGEGDQPAKAVCDDREGGS